MELARAGAGTAEAAKVCGTSGFVVHTLAFATFCFLRYGDDPLLALTEAISAGGDTDSIGAILGGWLGALHGESGLPGDLIGRIHDGPFGRRTCVPWRPAWPWSVRGKAAGCRGTRRRRPCSETLPSIPSSWATVSGDWCHSETLVCIR